ncbi:MAG: hypothetical protein J6N52_03705 [Clostridia bacterium]|nr:hypothetical protein [Clostridia bacterium]
MNEDNKTFEDVNSEAAAMFDAQEPPVQDPAQGPQQAAAEQVIDREAQIAGENAAENEQLRSQMSQLQAQLQSMQQQNQYLQNAMNQMSEQQKEETVEAVMEPPVLNFNELAFDDEETANQKLAEYANQMRDYTRNDIMRELEPVLSEAKKGIEEKEKLSIINQMKDVDELKGIDEHIPEIENIIRNNPLFKQEMPMDEKYITAYAILQGIGNIQHPKTEPTTEELLSMYDSNEDFRNALEMRKVEKLKQNQQVPAMPSSSGVANAAPYIEDKPKSWDDVNRIASKYFR